MSKLKSYKFGRTFRTVSSLYMNSTLEYVDFIWLYQHDIFLSHIMESSMKVKFMASTREPLCLRLTVNISSQKFSFVCYFHNDIILL